jgi:hypothetical protein
VNFAPERCVVATLNAVELALLALAGHQPECGVLDRMQEHQAKKRSLLRRLSISDLPRTAPPRALGINASRGLYFGS